jgi:pyridoxine 4-dehydrogenase
MFSAAGAGGMLAKFSNAEVEAPEAVLDLCSARGIAYLPFFPLAAGKVGEHTPALTAIAARHGASPSQIALAWLLARSPVILPIPGTSSLAHLEENWEARRIALSPEEMEAISAASG